jgi:ribosomal protein S18 acetylase RimI-like enzyme
MTDDFIASGFWLRPLKRSDCAPVLSMLSIIPHLYPRGDKWLETRMDEALDRKAYCGLAMRAPGPIGATIETPKGSRTIKLSTIWVAPPFRKMGVGHALIDACCARWVANGIANAYVTADTRRSEMLFPVLKRFGFERGPIEHQRYGTDRSEAVFLWTRDRFDLRTKHQ